MINSITFIIAARKGSQRVKNKNIKKFHNSNLVSLKIKNVLSAFPKAKILVSSNCENILSIAKRFNVLTDNRPSKYASSSIPMKEVYKYLASLVRTKYSCFLNTPSPFLKSSSLRKSVNIFLKKKERIDSLNTVTKIQEYLWDNKKAINYNPNNHPRSQDLKKYYALNFAINILPTNYMLKTGRIVGKKFHSFILNFPENFDIDEEYQFNLGEIIFKNFKKLKYKL